MKRFGWILVLSMLAAPCWAAKKITVQELKDMLVSMQHMKKSDEDVAAALKQVELTEELTRSTMNGLVDYVPGKFSTEQIYVLEARSAVLAPPASDLPTTPAPDAATQKAILDRAMDYASKTYAQLPNLTATKTTIRFQDNVEAALASSGMHSGAMGSATNDPGLMGDLVPATQFVHYINSAENTIQIHNGIEENPLAKDKTPWGSNGYIALLANGPALSTVLQEAQNAGAIKFLRWQTLNGKTAAVYSFAVEKRRSRYAVNYCCFPDVDQAGEMRFSNRTSGSGPQAHGNFQTATSYHNYKATVPYHGEFFVDPDTGIVVRLITEAEFKSSEVVHQEDQRIDYGPVTVGGKAMVLPIKTVVNTEVVPMGDSNAAGRFQLRHTLFTAEYKDYATQ